jgi:hypothetical protein
MKKWAIEKKVLAKIGKALIIKSVIESTFLLYILVLVRQ